MNDVFTEATIGPCLQTWGQTLRLAPIDPGYRRRITSRACPHYRIAPRPALPPVSAREAAETLAPPALAERQKTPISPLLDRANQPVPHDAVTDHVASNPPGAG